MYITSSNLCLTVGAVFVGLAWFVNGFTPDGLLRALTPSLQTKFAPRYPNMDFDALPATIDALMGSDMAMAQHQMVSNLLTSGIGMILCASLFFALPWLRRIRYGIPAVQTFALVITAWELLSFGIPLNTGRELYRRPLNRTPVHEFLRDQRDAYREAGGFAVLRAHDSVKSPGSPLPAQLPPDTLLNERIRDQQFYTFVDRLSHLPILEIYGPAQHFP